MSDQENFLTRWSRRKLEPEDKTGAADVPPASDASASGAAAEPVPSAEAVPEFDVGKLPSLDSIGANSDIRAFLQAGVPSALRHAALRRAWSADPAIRDYIGPNENFWEGAGPEGVPGFGDLGPEVDIKKLVAEVFGEAKPEPEAHAAAPSSAPTPEPEQENSSKAVAASTVSESGPTESRHSAAPDGASLLQRDENVASHHDDPQQEASAARSRRHGGAMPK